jgi:hypothetical protein
MLTLSTITTEDITTLVGLLTIEQKDQLVGVYYAPDCRYNPLTDINENWVISTEEMVNTINPDTLWVKELELIPYEPKPSPSPF